LEGRQRLFDAGPSDNPVPQTSKKPAKRRISAIHWRISPQAPARLATAPIGELVSESVIDANRGERFGWRADLVTAPDDAAWRAPKFETSSRDELLPSTITGRSLALPDDELATQGSRLGGDANGSAVRDRGPSRARLCSAQTFAFRLTRDLALAT
jgi:hypothetical protein